MEKKLESIQLRHVRDTLKLGSRDTRIFYTDGGCHNVGVDKGCGSWAFLEVPEDGATRIVVTAGYVNDTTNNRTEMLAVLSAIELSNGDNVHIISDSGYVVNGYQHPSYLSKWVTTNWKTSSGGDVLNRDLWERLLALSWHIGMKFTLVKGHNKDSNPIHRFWNSIVDNACTIILRNHRIEGIYNLTYDLTTGSCIDITRIAEKREDTKCSN